MKNIILVDDKKVFRDSLKAMLDIAGEVEIIGEASNGKDFLEQLDTKLPDIVFMDIEMPIMNGIEATEAALEKFPGLVIIGLSLYDDQVYVEKLIEIGARGYLLKESDNFDLLQTILKYPESDIFFSENLSYKPDISKNKIKNIFIADDSIANQELMTTALETSGFNVTATGNPFMTLDFAAQPENRYDLFVIDYKLPGMNGAELVMEIRKLEKYHSTPILILSSETGREKKQEAKEAGATGWLRKPFQLERFLNIIENSL